MIFIINLKALCLTDAFVLKQLIRPLSFTAYPFLRRLKIVFRFTQVKCFTPGFRGFALPPTAHRHLPGRQSRILSYFTFFRAKTECFQCALVLVIQPYASLSEGWEYGCDMWAGSPLKLVPAIQKSLLPPTCPLSKEVLPGLSGPSARACETSQITTKGYKWPRGSLFFF